MANMEHIYWRCFTQHCRGLVTLKKSLNYEERSSYNLVVEARDAGDNILSSTASIFVQVSAGYKEHLINFLRMITIQQVEDVQDQKPVFLNAPYSDTVEEGTPEGSEIFSVQVTIESH